MYFMYLCTLNLQIFSTNNLFSLVREPSTKSRKELFKESINLGEKKKDQDDTQYGNINNDLCG